MNASRALRSIFEVAVKLENDNERSVYLDRVCQEDGKLRSKVQSLIDAFFEAGSFLESSGLSNDFSAKVFNNLYEENTVEPNSSDQVGPYLILEKLGEGGFGAVYLAFQKEPVNRNVALKLIKAGMDTAEFIARFNIERQTLAMMDHPGIAKILDAGASASGRPYFVMEVVKGVPLSEYCDTHQLTIRDRLILFKKICDATQHAHQRGVIHRDLKPSNVLVETRDGAPFPKIIDFGIAKSVENSMDGNTIHTRYDQAIGTQFYMSPEQASSKGKSIDIRSDVYSLGVLLYELVSGQTPVTKHHLESSGKRYHEFVADYEPEPASKRISNYGNDDSLIFQNRNATSAGLQKSVEGDLDLIILKSLHSDPEQRYQTAQELLLEVGRFLNHEPIEARPLSTSYRLKKLYQKHKAEVLIAAGVALALVSATAISVWQAIEARRSQSVATTALASEKKANAELVVQRNNATTAQTAAEDARKKSDESLKSFKIVQKTFLELIRSPNPGMQGKDVTVMELIESNLAEAIAKLEDQPILQAKMYIMLGDVYESHGAYKEAKPFYEKAVVSANIANDPESKIDTLLGLAHNQYNHVHAKASLKTLIKVKQLLDQHKGLDFKRLLIEYYLISGKALRADRQYEDSNHQLIKAQQIASKHKFIEDFGDLKRWGLLFQLGTSYDLIGMLDKSIEVKKEALKLVNKSKEAKKFDVLTIQISLSHSLAAKGELEEAAKLMVSGTREMAKLNGEGHIDNGRLLTHQAILMLRMEKYQVAVDTLEKAYRISNKAGMTVREMMAMHRGF